MTLQNGESKVARKHLKRQQLIDVHSFLKEHLKINEDKTVTYVGQWSDQAVADRFKVSAISIRGLRQELFGPLHSKTKISGNTTELEKKLATLQSQFDDLSLRYNKLIDTLTINRIVQVKHLHTNETS